MKIKLDENVTTSLAPFLKDLGHDVHTTMDEGLNGRPDAAIWSAAQSEARLLLTQDLGFSDARKFAPGTHHGILLLRLGSPNQSAIISRISELFSREEVELWTGCLVVATENKVRVLRS
jgi:predicted nuclease of predicted toxin-antitoxin system